MTLWFLVTRLLVHHTGEASSTIHTTSQYAYTHSKTEMHEHKHYKGKKKSGLKCSTCVMFVLWTWSDNLRQSLKFAKVALILERVLFRVAVAFVLCNAFFFFYTIHLKQQQYCTDGQHMPHNQVPKFSVACHVFPTSIWLIRTGACVSIISKAYSYHRRSVVQMASLSASMFLLLLIITWSGFIL